MTANKRCPECKTKLKDAPGIGPYCPNKKCDRLDHVHDGPCDDLCQAIDSALKRERYDIL